MAIQDFAGGVTILSADASLKRSLHGFIQDSLKKRYKDEIQKASDVRQDIYSGQSKRYQEQTEKLGSVRGGIDLIASFADDAAENAKKIYDDLFEMKVYLENATRDPTYYAQEFDRKLADINSLANDVPASYNLIGALGRLNYDARDVDLKIDQNGKRITLSGQNLSSDYNIVDGNGKTWVPEFFSNSIKPYTAYPTNDTGQASYSTVLKASAGTAAASTSLVTRTDVNYSSSTVSFTADGTAYTGTLTKGGLGVAASWLYGRFSDAAGIAQAKSDVNAALAAAEGATATLKATKTFIQGQYDIVSNRIGEINQLMTSAMAAQLREEYDLQVTLRSKYEGVVMSLGALVSTQQAYQQIFSSGIHRSDLLGYLFDQTV
jgi:hypothetical protein